MTQAQVEDSETNRVLKAFISYLLMTKDGIRKKT